MKSFLATINYSSCNEDSRSECEALQIGPEDAVLCVTGSGARPLDLLTQRPRRIVSVDLNPCQSHLLHLKLSAIRRLSHRRFLAFVGVLPSERRLDMYGRMRAALPAAARQFWDENLTLIERGVLYSGRWERHIRLLARIVGAVRSRQRRRLFACKDVAEQTDYWHSVWKDRAWGAFLRIATARGIWKHVLRDPGFYRYVPEDFDVPAYLSECFDRGASSFLFRESAFATLLFYGGYRLGGPLPMHLQVKYYAALKERVDDVLILTTSVVDLLETTTDRFSAYSLSDIASYTSPAEYAPLWAGILRTAQPDARFCERQFLVKRALPFDRADPRPARASSLEARLRRTDRSMFYTFVAGRVPARVKHLPRQQAGGGIENRMRLAT